MPAVGGMLGVHEGRMRDAKFLCFPSGIEKMAVLWLCINISKFGHIIHSLFNLEKYPNHC